MVGGKENDMVIDGDKTTGVATMIKYIDVIHAHWHMIKGTKVENGVATCELHNGVVLSAKSPDELRGKLEEELA